MYMTLHWLISQSLFYFEFAPYDLHDIPQEHESSLGYSPIAILSSILLGSLMVLLLIGVSLWKLPSRMPLAGSCSLAISAACHPPRGENVQTVTLGPVGWGETSEWPEGLPDDASESELNERGHCSFTAKKTTKPSLTKWYT
ncbi:hypothetical protein BJX99DRAFT_227714 [Aspergillus californicus]